MILIDKQICYSPEPPMAYTYRGEGHGRLLHDDILAWNLAWLTCPALDYYLELPPEHGMAMVASNDTSAFGLAAMTVKRAHLTAYPDFPYLLTLLPEDFLNGLLNGPFRKLLIYQTLGPDWIHTVARRVIVSRETPLPMRPLMLTADGGYQLQIPIPKFFERVDT